MIVNNNTKDVAYLGIFMSKVYSSDWDFIYSVDKSSAHNIPIEYYPFMFQKDWSFIFDCSGTRYGFRIKELKSK